MIDPIVQAVVDKLLTRSAFGIAKYGVDLHSSSESTMAFLVHAQEEALDFANYLQVLITRLKEPADDVDLLAEALERPGTVETVDLPSGKVTMTTRRFP